MDKKKPPSIRKEFCEIACFGDTRTDPFRWLRATDWQKVLKDPASLPPDIRGHLDAENLYFEQTAAEFSPLIDTLTLEISEWSKIRDVSAPQTLGDHTYWSETGANGYPVYKRKNAATGETHVIFDAASEAQDFLSIGAIVPSPDGRLVACVVDSRGAGRFDISLRDAETGVVLACIPGTRGQVVWSSNGACLYYAECDDRNIAKRIKAHVPGTPPEQDVVVYEAGEAQHSLALRVSQSGEYLFIETRASGETTIETRFGRLDGSIDNIILIEPAADGIEYRLDHGGGDVFHILTNAGGAVNGKIVTAPVATPGSTHWRDVVPASPEAVISDFICLPGAIIRKESVRALPRLVITRDGGGETIVSFSAAPHSLTLRPPAPGEDRELLAECQTPAHPGHLYAVDLKTGAANLRDTAKIPACHLPDDYVVKHIFIKARDGKTDIPVTILHHASVKPDGAAPLYLYAYGAYGSGVPTEFSPNVMPLVERGAIYAIAHVPGGDEMGGDWHDLGRHDAKWNSFHGFIDAAEGLAALGYGEKGKIVIEGRSAGGLLVGAVLNERPDLFAGAIAGEAFLDVLNTMSDPTLPWVEEEKAEWGDPADADDYRVLRSYSPYDNIQAGKKYPPVLATTGIADACVMYWEPAKWIARLRDEASGGPFFLHTTKSGGHDGASRRDDIIRDAATEAAFALSIFEKCGYDVSPKAGLAKKNALPPAPQPPKPPAP